MKLDKRIQFNRSNRELIFLKKIGLSTRKINPTLN